MMNRLNPFVYSLFIIFFYVHIVFSQEKASLLIVAHGSPMTQWNEKVSTLEQDVKAIMAKKSMNRFAAVKVAFMEFAQPSIHSAIKDFKHQGIQHIFVVPLFIAPSGHSVFDIPTILGLYGDEEMRKKIKEEGTEIVHTKMNITIGPTLDRDDVVKKIMISRVQELSIEPDSEAVVLLAHGDDNFLPIWDAMCQKIGYYICAHTGIDYFDYAFVEIGQAFSTQGVPAILKASDNKPRTLVIGLYLSMGVDKMAETAVSHFMGQKRETKDLFAGKNIIFSSKGLLPDKRNAQWIAAKAIEWANEMENLDK